MTHVAGHKTLYPRVSVYAAMLAAAGLPLYIHLPRFASVELGLGLGTLGVLLLALRLIDLVQDPLFGWLIDRWPGAQSAFALLAALGLAVGFPALFWLTPETTNLWRLALTLTLLFSAYSLGMILLYGRSATLAKTTESRELLTLAGFREAGLLAGVILAASTPSLFASLGSARGGYPAFGMFLAALAVFAALATRPIWRRPVLAADRPSLLSLQNAGAIHLLLLGLMNSLPVAITSTLFLFFVQDHLQLGDWAGPLLILFFLSAGLSVPLWTRLSQRIGLRVTLLCAMPLAILSFLGASLLGIGQFGWFAVICIASGAALGADMVLLPALFSITLTRAGLQASLAFGLWSFVGKLGLALAAVAVLPLLARFGFTPGGINDAPALSALVFAYAILPCILKLGAWAMVWSLPKEIPAT